MIEMAVIYSFLLANPIILVLATTLVVIALLTVGLLLSNFIYKKLTTHTDAPLPPVPVYDDGAENVAPPLDASKTPAYEAVDLSPPPSYEEASKPSSEVERELAKLKAENGIDYRYIKTPTGGYRYEPKPEDPDDPLPKYK